MATVYEFSDTYTSECENCGTDLEDWDWMEDEMVFRTSCTCGTEYVLKPVSCTIRVEEGDLEIDEDEEDE